MSYRFITLIVAVQLAVCATAGAKERVTIGVLDFVATSGTNPEIADLMSAILVEEIEHLGDVRVVGEAELKNLLTAETKECLLELEWKCPAEGFRFTGEGREPAVRWVVSGRVTSLDELYLLTMKLFDLKGRSVAGRAVRRIQGSPDQLKDGLSDATQRLFKDVADSLDLVATVTVATRSLQLLEESPSAVSVYSREDIRSSGAVDLADFLREVPGFDIYRLKPAGPLVGARAFTNMSNNLVLPLIDGREALYEFTGFAPWSGFSVDLQEIERLEVIRGPGSALYGANALAGVVSITTIPHEVERRQDIFVKAGESGQQRLFGRITDILDLETGALSYGVAIGFEGRASPSDAQDNGILKIFRSHGHITYRLDREMELSLHGGVVQGGAVFFHNFGDWRLTNYLFYWSMAKADFSVGPSASLKLQTYYSRVGVDQFYRSRISAYNIWIADAPDNTPLSSNIDGKIQFDWQIVENLLLISGANIRYTSVDWEKVFLSAYDEFRGAGFLQVQWRPWKELQLTGGLRLDLNTLTDTALSPRLVAVLLPWKRHSFRVGYGIAFRKPSAYETKAHTVIDVFNPATPEIVDLAKTQLGNEDLRNEKVHSFEAGWRANFLDNQLRASVDLFFNLYRDMIIFTIDIPYRLGLPDMAGSTLQFENTGVDANALGGEAEVSWRLHEDLSLRCNVGIRHVADNSTNNRLPSEPILRINLGGRYTTHAGLRYDIAIHYVSEYEMPLIDPKNVFDNPRQIGLGNELLMVGRLGYLLIAQEQKLLEAGLNIVTPLGSPYREYPGAPIPQWSRLRHMSDWGGERLTRQVSFYLRGSF